MEFHYGLMTSPLQNATITIGPFECKTEEQELRPTAIIVDPNNPFDLEPILEYKDCPKPVDINCIRERYRNNN